MSKATKIWIVLGVLFLAACASASTATSTVTANDAKWTYIGQRDGNGIYRTCDGNDTVYYINSGGGYVGNIAEIWVIGPEDGSPCRVGQ